MKIRHEIILMARALDADSRGVEVFYFDPAKFNGTLYEYFEGIIDTDGSANKDVFLRDSSSNNHYSETELPILDFERYRAELDTYMTADDYDGWTEGGVYTYSPKVVVIQDTGTDPLTATEHQFVIGGCEEESFSTSGSALIYPQYWYYDSSNWDGTITFSAEVVWAAVNSKYAVTIKLQEDDGSWSWSDKVTIVNAGTTTSDTRTRVTFTPTTGRHYRIWYSTVGTKASYGLNHYIARIIVEQSSVTGITKFETQHLLQSTGEDSTGLCGMNTLWDTSNEWDGIDMEVYHQIECSSSSSDADLYEDADDTASKITSSDATGTANLVRSSDVEANMPSASDEIDSYVNTA